MPAESVDLVLDVARELGFDLPTMPMRFSDGMVVRRVCKIDDIGELLTLDLLVLEENLAPIWDNRIEVRTEFGKVCVVSREGLMQMKSWAGRDQDLADIRRLQDLDR